MKGIYKDAVRIKGVWYGRIRIRLPDGTERSKTKVAVSKAHAKRLADRLEREYLATATLDAGRVTFADLAARFKTERLQPAVYHGERKVSGYKWPRKLELRLDRLIKYFGSTLLADITPSVIQSYKAELIRQPTRYKRQRSPYDVNHQLRTLRLLLNFAVEQGWIQSNPFARVRLLDVEAEQPRERPERPGELDRLLAACTGKRTPLKYWIIVAIETAARVSEIGRIEWRDVLWEERLIRLRVGTTKTQRERYVPLTDWLDWNLRAWHEYCEQSERFSTHPEAKIFGGVISNKTAWNSACRAAGLEDLRRQDLRHWATTRLVNALAAAGIAPQHGMKMTGHTQERTFRRYITTDRAMVQTIGAALDAHRKTHQSGDAVLPLETGQPDDGSTAGDGEGGGKSRKSIK